MVKSGNFRSQKKSKACKHRLVCFYKRIHLHGTICGRCRRELCRLDFHRRFAVLLIELVRCSSCAKNLRNFRLCDKRCNVIRNNIIDARIARTHNRAAFENIPKSNPMTQKHRALRRNRRRDRFFKHRRHHFPKPILRMTVVKSDFARLRRRNRAKHQHPRIFIEQRTEFMLHPHADSGRCDRSHSSVRCIPRFRSTRHTNYR